ncbi:carbonic anhydrase 2-like [Musca domestica]|uniref:Carbonic anhydrase n=1 Tax=Musca domestica TaxID=7370 RepID=A0A9J7IF56_MUSDO|nr:carbonic anhydrase 2-like [Musca domestica]
MSLPVFGNLYQRLLFLLPLAADHFNYDEPEKWYTQFPQCAGFRQSPIIISTPKSIDILIFPLEFGFYDTPLSKSVKLHNNGHTVEFDIPPTLSGDKPYISGGLLDDDIYEAQQVHFHWGSPTRKGSEHIVNGNRYDIEMHIVHKNTKYSSVEIARQYEDGLAVVAVLFKVVKSDNVFYPGLNVIYNNLENVKNFNTTSDTMYLISMASLLGNINREDFYTYEGSLTTPPCSESVTWIVFSDVLPISFKELPKFWGILNEQGKNFVNVRPVQHKGFRKVFHRKPLIQFKYLG